MAFESAVDKFRDTLAKGAVTGTTVNATFTYQGGDLVVLPSGNIAPGIDNTLTAWLKPGREPKGSRMPGIQETDEYLHGRCVEPRLLPSEIRPMHETPCIINGVPGTFIWLNRIDHNFTVADIVGQNVNGYFRAT